MASAVLLVTEAVNANPTAVTGHGTNVCQRLRASRLGANMRQDVSRVQ